MNRTGVSIREFHYPEDYPAVLDLWNRAGPGVHVARSDQPGEIEKKLVRDPDLFLIAEVDGAIVGTVVGGFDGRRGMVYHLAVHQHLRNQGIAGVLMEELERRMRAHGCIRSYLLVVKENSEAIQFYENRGWDRMDHVLVYGKDL